MSVQNKNTIRFVREEALSKGRLDLIDGLYTKDYVYHGPPMLGDLRGPTAFRDMVQGFVAVMTDFNEVIVDQVSEGDKVVSRWTGGARHTGEFMGASPTGKEITWAGIAISRFVEGKIAEEWVEFDALSLLQQFGVVAELG